MASNVNDTFTCAHMHPCMKTNTYRPNMDAQTLLILTKVTLVTSTSLTAIAFQQKEKSVFEITYKTRFYL